jgi:DNA-directed RNA polymerase subunit omega
MMLYPAIGELEKVTKSRYALVTITAKRARQLLEKSEQDGTPLADKPVKLAINDIANGVVTCKDIFAEDQE